MIQLLFAKNLGQYTASFVFREQMRSEDLPTAFKDRASAQEMIDYRAGYVVVYTGNAHNPERHFKLGPSSSFQVIEIMKPNRQALKSEEEKIREAQAEEYRKQQQEKQEYLERMQKNRSRT